MKDTNKLITVFIVGAVVGGAVAWFLTSDKKDEVLSDLKATADKVKKDIADVIDKGREAVENFTERNDDPSDSKA